MELSERLNLEKFLAEQYNNIASVYRKLRNMEKSYEYNKKSLKIKVKLKDEIGIAAAFNNIGNIYRVKEDDSLALGYFKRALKLWEKNNYKRGMATVLNNISTILIGKQRYDEAISYIEKQLVISIALDLNVTITLAFINLAVVFINKNDFKIAQDYLDNAEQVINHINDKELLLFYYETKSKLYTLIENYKLAYEYSKKIIKMKDELFDERLSERVAEIESSYILKQKENEAELYRIKNVELVNAFNEIEKQKEQLSLSNRRLEETDQSREAIMRIVSHDLKNLIGSISSVVELMKFESIDEKSFSYLNIIEQSTEKALQLLKDLLDVNLIESQDYSLNLEKTCIPLLMENYKHAFYSAALKKNIRFSVRYDEEDIFIEADQERFWQLISNLIFNAIKFTKANGKVEVQIKREEDKCLIDISDTGVGISPEMIPFIFDKFTKAKRKGTDGEITYGLGLSIVKRLTELHKGEIQVESTLDQGTVFRLKFPVIEE
jgi:signal transduction histidine kinase